MTRNCRNNFCLWALAILTTCGVHAPVFGQVYVVDGGRVDPGSMNGRQVRPFGGRVDPGRENVPARPLGGHVAQDGANNRQVPVRPRPQPTSELLVFLQPGSNAARFANDHGLMVRYALHSDSSAFVFRAPSPDHAAAAYARMAHDRRVRAAYPNEISQKERFSFTPNDPYFHGNTPAPGWPGQWHLLNEWTAGLDARVVGAWNRDITGQGVVVGIVDDCLQTTHPDLAPNYVAADSWDFYGNDGFPDPGQLTEMHGTSVAGVAAARGGNGIGGTGAAPFAGLAGLRVSFDAFATVAQFVDATMYHSSGTNTHIKVKNHSYGNQFDYIPEAAEVDALAASAAAGTIHCFSAGNYRDSIGADSNMKQPQNSPDAITVAALGSSGQFATYSNYGANIFVTAPSSSSRFYQYPSGDWGSELRITTTDRTGPDGYNWYWSVDYFPDMNYTSQFGGTSSASPLVAGVMALGKQAQPALNTRFAKHLLALTSDVVDPNDASLEGDGDGVTPGSAWKHNAAGILFNQNYGMGLINADAFTRAATQYSGVTPLQVENTGLINVGAAIPDNNPTGIRRTFVINATTPLEEMLLTLHATHPWRGDVIAYLTSPSGTRARVMSNYWHFDPYGGTETDIHWTYCVNTFWGENPHGTWTLEVRDVKAGDVGTLDSFAVTARMGTLVSRPATSVSVANVSGAVGQTVALTATLRRASDGVALYGGTLSFKVNGTLVGTAVTNSVGVATRSYKIPATLGLGGKPLTVEFAGTSLYSASAGNGTLTINKANTTLSVPTVSGLNGQTVTLKATLKRATDGVVLYGGTLSFAVDGVAVGTAVTNSSGVASLSYPIPAGKSLGAHPVAVAFGGTTLYNASTGTGTLQVKANTTLAVTGVTGVRGTVVTLSAVLRRASNGVALSGGTIAFKVDGVAVGSATTDAGGTARLSYPIPAAMAVGSHAISAAFGGSSYYVASSGTATLTVQ